MASAELLTRLTADGPKRILSLDGGGIRGAITVGFLEKIEAIVRTKLGRRDAVLADYFDLIGGTSTGAIIAALLALGRSVAQVKAAYLELGAQVFSARSLKAQLPLVGDLYTKLSATPLEKHAVRLFGEHTTLGSPLLRSGLCIVTKRADTFSTWPYHNHPKTTYPENLKLPLWKLVRASAAAPTYFRPVMIDVGEEGTSDPAVFIDGAVSMANNPAWQLFLVATLRGFKFQWKTGAESLLLVSVGTGRWDARLTENELMNGENLFWARSVPNLLMNDSSEQNELILQYLSQSPTARRIDWEVGSLEHDVIGGQPQLSYLRYDAVLEEKALSEVAIAVTTKELTSLRDMSVGKNAQRLYDIGVTFAGRDVKPEHF